MILHSVCGLNLKVHAFIMHRGEAERDKNLSLNESSRMSRVSQSIDLSKRRSRRYAFLRLTLNPLIDSKFVLSYCRVIHIQTIAVTNKRIEQSIQ